MNLVRCGLMLHRNILVCRSPCDANIDGVMTGKEVGAPLLASSLRRTVRRKSGRRLTCLSLAGDRRRRVPHHLHVQRLQNFQDLKSSSSLNTLFEYAVSTIMVKLESPVGRSAKPTCWKRNVFQIAR